MNFFQYKIISFMLKIFRFNNLLNNLVHLFMYILARHLNVIGTLFDSAFGKHPHLICFAVKSCSNIGVLNIMAKLGSGFDIVSQGELERVLAAGGDASKVVFFLALRNLEEIMRALEVGIRCFNVESVSELKHINQIAEKWVKSHLFLYM